MPSFKAVIDQSIRLKLTFFVALLIILIGLIFSWVGYLFARDTLYTQINDKLTVIAFDRQTFLLTYLRQQQELMSQISSRTTLRKQLEAFQENRIAKPAFIKETSSILKHAKEGSPSISAILILDPQGIVITASDVSLIGQDFSSFPNFKVRMQGEHFSLPAKINGKLQVYLTKPVTSAIHPNKQLGIVVTLMDIEPMLRILQSTKALGETGEVVVGTRIKDKIRFLYPQRKQPIQEIPFSLDADNPGFPMAAAITGKEGFIRGLDYQRVPVLAAYRPVGYGDWGLVIKVDEAQADAPIHHLLNQLIGLQLVLLLLGLGAAYVLARRFTQPLLEMSETAIGITKGERHLRVAVKSRDEIGQLAQSLNLMTDEITSSEMKIRKLNAELEQRVIERTAQLQAVNRELEAFSYSVSHDLRAPLRAIDGFSQALIGLYADKLDEKGIHYLNRVREGSQQMGKLIDDMLSLSRLTRDHLNIEDKVNLSALAKDITDDLQQQEPERNVDIKIQKGMYARADKRLIQAVLQNLIGNAWKFTSKKEQAWIEFGVTERDGSKVYFVKDNGAGFDMAYVGKLFGAFQRLHGTNEFEGTGIGLATVQRVIHRHGGEIWSEGEVGKGATFFFTLEPAKSIQENKNAKQSESNLVSRR